MSERKIISILYASSNQQGNSALLVDWLLAEGNQEKYEFEKFYLNDLQIEFFSNENRHVNPMDSGPDSDTRKLIDRIEQANQVIITTPIWNFGIPGVLKNFLDRCLALGRIKSGDRRKKVPAWRDKQFYLLFTMGAKWYLAWPNYLGILQTVFTLWYYGANVKVLNVVYDCGNGSQVVIAERSYLQNSLRRKGRKLFR